MEGNHGRRRGAEEAPQSLAVSGLSREVTGYGDRGPPSLPNTQRPFGTRTWGLRSLLPPRPHASHRKVAYFRPGMGDTRMFPLASDWRFGCGETHVTSVSKPWGQPRTGRVTTPLHCNAPKVCRTWVSSPSPCPAPPPGTPTSVVFGDTRWKMHPHHQEGGHFAWDPELTPAWKGPMCGSLHEGFDPALLVIYRDFTCILSEVSHR